MIVTLSLRRAISRSCRLNQRSFGPVKGTERVNARTGAGASHENPDRRGRQPASGSGQCAEHLAVHRIGGAGMREVVGDRVAHVDGQRQALVGWALAANQDLALVPVNVLQPEPGDFSRTRAQTRQEEHHRIAAPSCRGLAISCRQQRLDLGRLRTYRQERGEALARHESRPGEVVIEFPGNETEPKEARRALLNFFTDAGARVSPSVSNARTTSPALTSARRLLEA